MTKRAIHATLLGPDMACADGHVVRHATAPALALCHKLVELGYNDDRPMLLYRNDILAMRLKSLAWAVGSAPVDYSYTRILADIPQRIRARRARPRVFGVPRVIEPLEE